MLHYITNIGEDFCSKLLWWASFWVASVRLVFITLHNAWVNAKESLHMFTLFKFKFASIVNPLCFRQTYRVAPMQGLSFTFTRFSSSIESAATFCGGLLKNSEAKELFKLVSGYRLLTEAYALYIWYPCVVHSFSRPILLNCAKINKVPNILHWHKATVW